MEKENVDVQDVDLEQEEESATVDSQEETQEESITISKDKFKAMQRKAIAYDADHKSKPKIEEKETIIKKESSQISDTKYERLELKVEGYPDKVIDDILALGGKKALANPLIKKAVDDLVEQYKADVATSINSSSKSDFDKKYSESDLQGMKIDELEKILPHKEE